MYRSFNIVITCMIVFLWKHFQGRRFGSWRLVHNHSSVESKVFVDLFSDELNVYTLITWIMWKVKSIETWRTSQICMQHAFLVTNCRKSIAMNSGTIRNSRKESGSNGDQSYHLPQLILPETRGPSEEERHLAPPVFVPETVYPDLWKIWKLSVQKIRLRPANGACISLLKTISAMTIFKSVAAFLQSMMPRQQGVYFQYFSASLFLLGVRAGGLMFHGPWRYRT